MNITLRQCAQAFTLISFSALTLTASAQLAVTTRPSVRVTAKVDSAVTTRLAGTHPSVTDHATLGARLASSKSLPHLRLVLTPSAEQETALQSLMDQLQDKTSPNFHKWLTPESFGEQFGVATADIAKVTAWMQDQGLTVESVAKNRRVIVFSGTVGQVETAFHTQVSSLQVGGEQHFANTTDITVPTALSGVVRGIARLNDFFPKTNLVNPHTVAEDRAANPQGSSPQYGGATGTHYVSPGDVAVIYNTTPLTSAGIDGTGTSISILAQSNIDLADVQEFKTMFQLKKNDPNIIVVGQDPGLNADDGEAYLDAEWGGAMATGATINFLVSAPSLEGGGVDASALYAVDNNLGDIISLSYGGCEGNNGASGTAFWNALWEQAAAQGQTAFVSTGDSSAAGCDSSGNTYAVYGYGVNALGSSAYNVAVGGSMFVDYGPSQYWGASGGTVIPFTNALSYIPETPWNQGRLAAYYLNSGATGTSTGIGIVGAGGGISIYTARPPFQTGYNIPSSADPVPATGTGLASGSPIAGLHRLVPDVVNVAASGHDPTLYCASSICSVTATGTLTNAGLVGGTSVATPVQASMQALINQKNGGRQGNVLYHYYSLAAAQYAASATACQVPLGSSGSTVVTLPASTCNFHDVITGSNLVPTASSGTASIGFSAGVGFDEASGLGSMNVANVANNWSSVTGASTRVGISLTPATGITHGATQTLSTTVSATSGSGTPTGDISLIAETSSPNGPNLYTLTGGSYNGPVATGTLNTTGSAAALPAGSYNVHVHYGGDSTFAPSDSASIPVSIAKENSSVTVTDYNIATDANGTTTAQTVFPYGADVYLDTYVVPASASGVPTGTVTYTVVRNGNTTLTPLTTKLDPAGNTYLIAGVSFVNFYLKANYPALAAGSYVVTASYSGDSNYAASTITNSFTVLQQTPTVSFTGPTNVTSGGTALFGYGIANVSTITNPNTTVFATGTVTFTNTTTASTLGTCTLSAAASCSFSTTALTTTGANSISAVYSGDANYAAATNTLSVTVGTLTSSTLALTATGTATAGAIVTLKATMSPTAATGTVSFFDSGNLLGTVTLASGVASLPQGTTAAGGGTLTAGTHSLSATYSGSATYATSTGTLSKTIAQNTSTVAYFSPAQNSIYGQTFGLTTVLKRSTTTSVVPYLPMTGTVTFTDSVTGSVLGTATPVFDTGGYGYYVATSSTNALLAGTHTISVKYSGDTNFTSVTSTASATTTVVAKLTPAIVLTSPSAVTGSGSSVVLTATIPLSGSIIGPTGGVSFYDGATLLSTVFPVYSSAAGGDVATYTASSLSRGSHSITAVLASDANFNTATSAVLPLSFSSLWVANAGSSVSGLGEDGTALTPSAVTGGGTGIAIDSTGNIWSLGSNSLIELPSTAASQSSYTGGGLNAPSALAIDGAGVIWVANAGGNSVSVFSNAGAAITPATGLTSTSYSAPSGISVDTSGNVWVINSVGNSVSEIIGVAAPVAPLATSVVNSTTGVRP